MEPIVTVFFLVFHNAFTGGSSIPSASIENAVQRRVLHWWTEQ